MTSYKNVKICCDISNINITVISLKNHKNSVQHLALSNLKNNNENIDIQATKQYCDLCKVFITRKGYPQHVATVKHRKNINYENGLKNKQHNIL